MYGRAYIVCILYNYTIYTLVYKNYSYEILLKFRYIYHSFHSCCELKCNITSISTFQTPMISVNENVYQFMNYKLIKLTEFSVCNLSLDLVSRIPELWPTPRLCCYATSLHPRSGSESKPDI